MNRLLLLPLMCFSMAAPAYFSTIDTGDIPESGEYRLAIAPQFLLSNGSGMNLSSHFDTGVSESGAVRVLLGAGSHTDFQTGLFYKYVPIPDVGNQPAIGFRTGVIWARDGGVTQFSARFHPIVSKRFDNEWGEFNVYTSLPIGITAFDGGSAVPIQMVGGTEWKTFNYKNILFGGEIGFDLSEAFSYLTLFTTIYFKDDAGVLLE